MGWSAKTVLVAVSIPVFTKLEKSRESVDLNNARTAYTEVMLAAMTEDATVMYGGRSIYQDGIYKATVTPLSQKVDGWATDVSGMSLGGVPSSQWIGLPKENGSCTVAYDPSTGVVTISWGDGGASGGSGQQGGGTSTPLGSGAKSQIESILSNYMDENIHAHHTVTLHINDGVVSVDNSQGNKHDNVTAEQVIALLKNKGIEFDDSDRMLMNGELVTDTVEVTHSPGGGHGNGHNKP